MRVKFYEDTLYETDGRGRGPVFQGGKVYDLPNEFAQRWTKRAEAVTVPVDDKTEVEPDPREAYEAKKAQEANRAKVEAQKAELAKILGDVPARPVPDAIKEAEVKTEAETEEDDGKDEKPLAPPSSRQHHRR